VLNIIVKREVLFELFQEICLPRGKRHLSDDFKHITEVKGRVECHPPKVCIQKQPGTDDVLSEELMWYALIHVHLEIQPGLLKQSDRFIVVLVIPIQFYLQKLTSYRTGS
jgi:hypothetical protein